MTLDLDRLLRLRLVVARHGEMDRSAWWNTKGMLGTLGSAAVSRGLPRTHRFAQARAVFAVARSRCGELFDAPGSTTLWKLPADIEDQFDEHWQGWLRQSDDWNPFFDDLTAGGPGELLVELAGRDLISPDQTEAVQAMRRSAAGRAVQIAGDRSLDDDLLALLAAAFAKGEHGAPAVPYARLVDAS